MGNFFFEPQKTQKGYKRSVAFDSFVVQKNLFWKIEFNDFFNICFMKNFLLIMPLCLGMLTGGLAQNPTTGNAAFDAELGQLLSFTVPLMGVSELEKKLDEVHLFDVREKAEYKVSHITGAVRVGFEKLDISIFDKINKDEPVVLYCSVGYRSEKIGERLKEMGFTNVSNLYGSIFEWANKGLPLENSTGKRTSEIHTYNKEWSKWVDNPAIKKVW